MMLTYLSLESPLTKVVKRAAEDLRRGTKRPRQGAESTPLPGDASPQKKQKTQHVVEPVVALPAVDELDVDVDEAADRFHPQILGRYYDFDKTRYNLKVFSCRPWNNKVPTKGRFNVTTRRPTYRPKRYPLVAWTLPTFPLVSIGRHEL
ncbi:hypothetical protein SDRG_05362 [Saprolegnia diclina VS20]|uniref:Uncharacterized protein n=1 Tax=Saprolegnia diclina (strain VS20) TaxID=1156394 RepID=T0QT04_SAPDV|nr:hypothetical protein SDRG_05362 [Saprolegnia diclina VS20]EQC37135.1 hypothetical protein SDRG_05362 [Saprolegnia diclina VS20]|eukprot:XP_008609297.1 hypothetical protein SDRG_05362 [Saprolegnia diclina VS20]